MVEVARSVMIAVYLLQSVKKRYGKSNFLTKCFFNPNPTVNELQIILGEDYESFNKWQIVDLQGKLIIEEPILQQEVDRGKFSIDIRSLPASVYVIKLLGTR